MKAKSFSLVMFERSTFLFLISRISWQIGLHWSIISFRKNHVLISIILSIMRIGISPTSYGTPLIVKVSISSFASRLKVAILRKNKIKMPPLRIAFLLFSSMSFIHLAHRHTAIRIIMMFLFFIGKLLRLSSLIIMLIFQYHSYITIFL